MTGTSELDGQAGALPGSRAWTDEQRQAIARREGDLLLDASAGSGKTSVLVERFAAAVLLDGVDVGAILTITFTEKAAAELRDRIRGRLQELGAHDAARRTEGAWISTIHGFCARLLRTHALAAGLDPRFTVLDAYASKPLVEGAFDEALTALAESDPRTVDLIAAYTVPTLRAAILSVYDQLRSAGQADPRLPEIADREDLVARQATAATRLCAAAEPLVAELAAVPEPGVRVREALAKVERCLELVPDPELWPGELGTLTLPRSGAALTTDACEAYAAALSELRVAAGARAAAPYRDLLDGLLAGYAECYRARKRAVSGLDFEDLELDCRELLRDDAELRERYRERFAAIMVDEFQDTNRIQLELIESIAHGNLFTVGDAQQSIYGFRHADVSLFRQRSGRLAAAGARETLRTNFRTRPEVIDVLNPAFAQAMGEEFVELRAGRPAGQAPVPAGETVPPTPAVELIVADKAGEWDLEGMAAPWRLAEAHALAARIGELVADGAAPGEIVVLMRATTDMRAYERALERRGLPTYVIGGRGYWGHPQVLDLLAYLRALSNPRDEEPLYGVLASPLVGASLDALVILAETARTARVDPWRALRDPSVGLDGLSLHDREALASFAGWFEAERRRSARASIEELIEAALDHSGYDLAMLAMPGGTRRLANVRKLMRLGREYEAGHGPDLRGFLALVDDREGSADALREGEAPVEGEGLDAIRLMTIHRAKGLEFPIVCVADLGRSPRPPSAILRVADGPRIGLRLVRAGTGTRESALDYTAIGEELRAAEDAEERRLFYVAMTRARDRLLLSGAARFEGWLEGNTRRVGGGPIAWIAPALVAELATVIAAGGGEVRRGDGRLVVRVATPEDLATEPRPISVAAGQPADGLRAPVISTQTEAGEPPVRRPTTLSYSALTEYSRCGYRFYAERVLGLPGLDAAELEPDPESGRPAAAASEPAVLASAVLGPRPRTGAQRGILAHALLERLDFRRPVVPATDLARAAAPRARP